ncbi:MAG: cysteine-rich CWC family protein [Pseudobacteriovorax sp.]|nr:cysteine-rich CWC family protein [Pseudobacteriovorax sp.]
MKYLPDHCSLCERVFICKVGNIGQCECIEIELSNHLVRFLREEFESCLCVHCLRYLSSQQSTMLLNKETLMEKVKTQKSLTMYEMVFPSQTNHYGTLFGGEALSIMDKAAFMVASRYARRNMVTVSSDKTDFKNPIKTGQLVEVLAKVKEVGNTSLKVTVDLIGEDLRTGDRALCTSGQFTMVALDDFGKPVVIPTLQED